MAVRKATIIIDVESQSLQELDNEIKQLEASIQSLKIGTDEWNNANKQLGGLKSKFNEATASASKLQGQVENIGTTQQIQSVVKLGSGMVGAFTVANGALSLLGDNEAFEKMTAHATTLMSIMGGLQQVSELFNKDTLSGIKKVGSGFTNLTRTVKNSSRGMKVALASTGIGLLVVAVGLLIANWEKFANLIKRTDAKAMKNAEQRITSAEKQVELGKQEANQKMEQLKIENELNTTSSEAHKQSISEVETNNIILDQKRDELDLLEANIVKLELVENKINKGFDESLIKQRDLTQARVDDLEALENLTKAQERNLKLAKKDLDNYKERLAKRVSEKDQEKIDAADEARAQRTTLELEIKILEKRKESGEVLSNAADEREIINDNLEKLQNQLIIINAENFKAERAYKKQVEIIDEQVRLLKETKNLNGEISKDTQKQINNLEAQKSAMIRINTLRKEQLEFEGRILDIEISKNRQYDIFNTKIYEANKQFNEFVETQRMAARESDISIKLFELDKDTFEEAKELRDSFVNFDAKRSKILEDRLQTITDKNKSNLKVTAEGYKEIQTFLESFGDQFDPPLKDLEVYAKRLIELSGTYENNLSLVSDDAERILGRQSKRQEKATEKEKEARRSIGAQIIQDAQIQVAIARVNFDIQDKALKAQRDAIEDQRTLAKDLKLTYIEIGEEAVRTVQDLDVELVILEQELALTTTLEEQVFLKGEISRLESERAGAVEQVRSAESEIITLDAFIVKGKEDIVDIGHQIAKNADDIVDLEKTTTDNLKEQLRLYNRIQGFVEKYGDEMQAVADIGLATMELQATLLDERARKEGEIAAAALEAQGLLIKGANELIKLNEEANKKSLSDIDKLKKLQEDANGDRYDELEAMILLKEGEHERELERQETELDFERAKWEALELARVTALTAQSQAEHDAAKNRKAQAIIDGIIQTALAVVSALPNIFLSVAVGILGAVGVATIAAQKVEPAKTFDPEPVPFEEGGFTGVGEDNEPAGVVHRNEYVVPARVTKTQAAQQHIEALEKQRTRGYVSGGYVPPNSEQNFKEFDYDRIVSGIADAISQLPPPQVGLVNISNGLNDVKLSKQKAGLSR